MKNIRCTRVSTRVLFGPPRAHTRIKPLDWKSSLNAIVFEHRNNYKRVGRLLYNIIYLLQLSSSLEVNYISTTKRVLHGLLFDSLTKIRVISSRCDSLARQPKRYVYDIIREVSAVKHNIILRTHIMIMIPSAIPTVGPSEVRTKRVFYNKLYDVCVVATALIVCARPTFVAIIFPRIVGKSISTAAVGQSRARTTINALRDNCASLLCTKIDRPERERERSKKTFVCFPRRRRSFGPLDNDIIPSTATSLKLSRCKCIITAIAILNIVYRQNSNCHFDHDAIILYMFTRPM